MFADASSDIVQLDGLNSSMSTVNSSCNGFNESFSSSYDDLGLLSSSSSEDDLGDSYYSQEDEDVHLQIPVIVNIHCGNVDNYPAPAWYEPVQKQTQFRRPVRRTIRRDNRLEKSSQLPVIAVSNLRSLMPKINNFVEDIHQRNIGVALLTEVWEKAQKKKHIYQIDRMLHMEGLKYISTPRPSSKRGGGAAIVVPIEKFNLEKLDILIPHNLEIVYGLLRPKSIQKGGVSEIICVSFYCPPKSRKKTKLLDHILTAMHVLMTKYPNAGVIIGADKNELNISSLIDGLPRVRQIVSRNTHKDKILDIILTNLHQFYKVPFIAPPVTPDDPSSAKPSDHSIPIAVPLSDNEFCQTREYQTKTVRPLPDENIEKFGNWIKNEKWEQITGLINPTEQVRELEQIFQEKLDAFCPEKNIKYSNCDLPFITSDIKYCDRRVKREYRKHGRSEKYLNLKEKYDRKFRNAARNYMQKNVTDLKLSNPGKSYSILKRMGAPPGSCESEGTFTLQNHQEQNLSTEESIEQIAQYFAQISQEYPPLDLEHLPQRVCENLDTSDTSEHPKLSVKDVSEQIQKSKKPKSGVPGDLPKKLTEKFYDELAIPLTVIYQNIIHTKEWPAAWRTEYGIPLQKQANPDTEDQLRIISLTSFFSKNFEHFVIEWLMDYVGDLIDPNQYGGQKGNSITHYLIEFINFVLYNQDMSNPRAILAMMVDFKKAFNRQNHNRLVTLLSDMGVPGWLLKIVIGFLSDRELIVRYKGCESQKKALPGGSPQGTRLGMFLFLIMINFAGFPFQEIERETGKRITQKRRKPLTNLHLKYVDDLSYLTAIHLKKKLIGNPETDPVRPLAYHNRTEHVLPQDENALQKQMDRLSLFADENEMQINSKKTKLMLFNTSKIFDFMPEVTDKDGICLEIVEEFKLLGVMVTSDLKWNAHTKYICARGYSKLWMLRNLKRYGASIEDLVDVYIKQCRSVLEMAVPAWSPGLTVSNSLQIERVQKTAFAIILGEEYSSYSRALLKLKMKPLSDRRQDLCLSFAKKAFKNEKFSKWFCNTGTNDTDIELRNVKTRTKRYLNSPLPYLTGLLNQELQ